MSKHIVSLVYRKKIGSMMRKAVLSYMADRANDDGTGIWCSKGTIANEIEASRQGVITTIKGLVEDGLLIEVGERKCANGYTMEYAIDLKKVHALGFVTGKKIDTSKSVPVNDDDITCQSGLHDPSMGLTQTVQNLPEPSKKSDKEIFEEAWTLYRSCPLKANQTKKLAKAAWPKAVKTAGGSERILKAIQTEVQARKNPDGFIAPLPDMHRWLKNERWNDVEEAPPAGQALEFTREDWALAMRQFVDLGEWPIPAISPPPTDPDCKAPADMLEAWRKHYGQEKAA